MSELRLITSGTRAGDLDSVAVSPSRSTYSQSIGTPTAVLVGTLLALQLANVAHVKASDVHRNSSLQVTTTYTAALFDDLIKFHQTLAASQRELPDDAARLLRENLWQLYD